MKKLQRMTGYIVRIINCDESHIDKMNLETVEEARQYIEDEYCLVAPDTKNGVEYTYSDDVKIIIEKAPTVDELMTSLNGLLKGLEEAGTYGWYLSDYNKIREVLYAVGSTDNWYNKQNA